MKLLYLFAALCLPVVSPAQSVGIGTTTPSSAAALEIRSTSKGFLLPRLTTAQINAIANPEPGLMVFNTTTQKFCGYRENISPVLAAENTVKEPAPFMRNLMGQTFTASVNGVLNAITVSQRTIGSVTGSTTLKIYIYASNTWPSTATLIGTITRPLLQTPNALNVTYDCTGLNIPLVAGQLYSFDISASGIPPESLGYELSYGNPYAGGNNNYICCASSVNWDWVFRVTVSSSGVGWVDMH